MSRLADMPVYAQRPDAIDAAHYNLWRRARSRFGTPLRLVLPGLKGMALILDDHAWACVDASQNDLPVLAWVELEDAGRDAIHTPVPCQLNYYHFAASALRARVLDLMARELEARLA
jgi:hypothetical protein